MNGTVNTTLKWDCYDCVDWPTLRNMHHPAVDYLSSDTNIVATADGVVVKMNTGCGGQGCGNSLGNWLFLKHTLTDGSTLFSFYAHMAEIAPAVTQGACIKTGQKVGVIGNTGIASAAHLHFSIQTNTNLLGLHLRVVGDVRLDQPRHALRQDQGQELLSQHPFSRGSPRGRGRRRRARSRATVGVR